MATSRISASTMREMLKPECSKKSGIFGREDRLAQVRRNVVVVNDDAPFDRELADQLAVLAEHARDGVGRVVVERADFGEVVGIGEQHAAQRAEQGGGHKQGGNAGVTSVANGDFHLNPQYTSWLSGSTQHQSSARHQRALTTLEIDYWLTQISY